MAQFHEVTTSVQIVLPQHCNGYKKPRLFGGQLMAWIDIVGAVAARRYAKKPVTTVCVDNLNFIKAAYLNETVVQEAVVTWTGSTSIEVRIDSFVERIDGQRELVNRCYTVFVALDDDDKPSRVEPFVPQNKEEEIEYFEAIKRHQIRLRRHDVI